MLYLALIDVIYIAHAPSILGRDTAVIRPLHDVTAGERGDNVGVETHHRRLVECIGLGI